MTAQATEKESHFHCHANLKRLALLLLLVAELPIAIMLTHSNDLQRRPDETLANAPVQRQSYCFQTWLS